MLTTATSLRRPIVERQLFDPTNPDHLESLDTYLRTGNWGEVQFFAELPYVEVPITVLMKFAMYERGVSAETEAERQVRFATKNLVQRVEESRRERRTRLRAATALTTLAVTAMNQQDTARRLAKQSDLEEDDAIAAS